MNFLRGNPYTLREPTFTIIEIRMDLIECGGGDTQVELNGVGMNEMNYFGAPFGGLFNLSSISIK